MTAKFGTSTKNTSQVLFDAIPHASWFWYTCRRCSIAATEHRSSQSLVVAAPHKHPPTHTLNSDAVAVRWDADVTWCQPKTKIGLFQRFSTAKIRQLSFFTFCRMEQLSQLTRREAEFTCVFFWGKYSDLQLRTIQAVQQIFINLSSNVNLSRIGMIGEFEVTSWITAIFRCVFLCIYIRSMVSIPSSLDFIKA